MPVEDGEHLLQRAGEHRGDLAQPPAHARPLRALAGEQHGQLSPAGSTPHHRRARPAQGEVAQSGEQLAPVPADDRRPVFEGGPAGRQGPCHVRHVELGTFLDVGAQPLGLRPQRVHAGGRQDPGTCRGGAGHTGGRRTAGEAPLGRCLLHDGVRVGAADTEGRHGGPPGPVTLRPGPRLVQQRDRAGGPVHMGARLPGVQSRRQQAVPHRHDHLDHASDTGSRLGMTDVGLHRPQQQRSVHAPVLPVGGQDGLGLDGVPEHGAGAVRLDGVHLVRGQPGVGQGVADHPFLRCAVRRGQAVARAIGVDRRTPQDGQHRMARPASLGQGLQHQQADAFGPGGAVGVRGEWFAPAVRGQPTLLAELHEHAGAGHHRDPACERQRALAAPQRLGGQMQGDQRRRARRVNGDRRAAQTEGVCNPAGGHAERVAGQQVAVQAPVGLVQARAVVLGHGADKDPGLAAVQRLGRDTGPFDRLPGDLQQQPLLGIHRRCLARGDAEEPGVEQGGVVEETALADIGPPRLGLARPVQGVDVPPAVGGEAADGVPAAGNQLPQLLRGAHPAGIAACHSDDGDRLVNAGGDARRGSGNSLPARDLAAQMTCQGQRRGMFEQHCGRHPQAGGLGQALAQPDAGERVEAEFPERRAHVDGVRRGVPEQGGDVPADQVRQDLLPLGIGAAGQAEGQGGRRLERLLLVRFVCFVRLRCLRHDDRPAAGLAGDLAVGPDIDLAVVAGGLGYGHVRPVAPADERVRRQAHRPAVLAGEHLVPVELSPADVQADGGGEQCVGFGLVLGQRRYHGDVRGVRGRSGQAVLGQRREHTVRAEFQEGGDAVRLQLPDAVAEPHGLPDVAHPVAGRAQVCGGSRLAGDSRNDRDARRRERKALRHLAELGQHAVHQRRVRGKADPQPGDLAPHGLEMGGDGRGLRLLAGHHGRHRTVDRGNAQVLLAAGEQRQHLLLGGLQRDHRAARWKPVHQPPSCGHQRTRVGKIQNAGGVGGGQFTEGVTEQETRL